MNDPFDIFQIEPAFELDLNALGKRHREISSALHPDRYAGRPAAERRSALGRAIEVNEAWRVLKDPVRRSEALFARLGLPVGEGTEPPADPELLMEMMERREKLRELGRAGDAAGVEALCETVEVDRKRSLGALGAGFAKALAAQAEDSNGGLEGLRAHFGELRYYRRFFDEAEAILDEIG